MPQYTAPLEDFSFIMRDWLNVDQYKEQGIEGFGEVDSDLVDSLLNEAAKYAQDMLLPIYQKGDEIGCKFENGNVTMPPGVKEAYDVYTQSGWNSFSCKKDYGGQEMPEFIYAPIAEIVCSCNLPFGITVALTKAAYNAILVHGSDALKQKFLPNMVSGKWTGVMCLTEPQCGTDLGLIRTKAEPNDDGTYTITGNKIFISSGEQDLTENIVHLILAKLPDAPPGVKGISLFLAPKVWVNDDGSLGDANNISCGSIEHKMGIHASPTCAMNYDGTKGYLVGEPHKGLRAMFTMMNEARLLAGVQGIGVGELAYQNAVAYAKERLQGRGLKGAVYPDKAADPLIVHPDIRRMLLTIRSFTEGARAWACQTALRIDLSSKLEDPKEQEAYDEYVQFVTPIIKSYCTDMGFDVANMALQIYGGHGYIAEYGIEQMVRDARIAQIYEGANGIQALDLVGRKLPKHTGRYLRHFFHPATEFVEKYRDDPEMTEFTKPLYKALDSAQKASLWIAMNGVGNPDDAAAGSAEYLRIMALAILGYTWADMARVCKEKIKSGEGNQKFYQTKLETARFFMAKMLPYHYGLLASIAEGSKTVMAMEEAAF